MQQMLMMCMFIIVSYGYTYPMAQMNDEQMIAHDFEQIKSEFKKHEGDVAGNIHKMQYLIYYVHHVSNTIDDDIWGRQQYNIDVYQAKNFIGLLGCHNPEFTIPEIINDELKLVELKDVAGIANRDHLLIWHGRRNIY